MSFAGRVMLRRNLCAKIGLVNGACGVLNRIECLDNGEVHALFIKFDHIDVEQQIQKVRIASAWETRETESFAGVGLLPSRARHHRHEAAVPRDDVFRSHGPQDSGPDAEECYHLYGELLQRRTSLRRFLEGDEHRGLAPDESPYEQAVL